MRQSSSKATRSEGTTKLRNRVYDFLLLAPYTIPISTSLEFPSTSSSHHALHQSILPPPITRASRQLRRETLALFYGGNTFELYLHSSENVAISRVINGATCWLTRMGEEQRGMVREMVLCTRVGMDVLRVKRPYNVVVPARREGLRRTGGQRLRVSVSEEEVGDETCVANRVYGVDLRHYRVVFEGG
ncbi:hypothetical protein B0A55_10238 [Friedmanniomyces simplex]|uniref:Uncharacterized protein n=1 Tax=Friedmanniomyces simplex TaxID=329884 RepID=A0A4V5NEJ5_9PEZI|nr:hypothetical protein B0A55_10238 [Friedmanniomyces simplex]